MTTVWKYQLKIVDVQDLALPRGAVLLTVQVQDGTPCLWALVDPEQHSLESRRFDIVGTGHEFDSTGLAYVGTFQLRNGALVFHLFERTRKEAAR